MKKVTKKDMEKYWDNFDKELLDKIKLFKKFPKLNKN
jgi:hypothetical protein